MTHPYGRLSVAWTREEGGVRLQVTLPPNTTAHIRTEAGDIDEQVGSGEHTWLCQG